MYENNKHKKVLLIQEANKTIRTHIHAKNAHAVRHMSWYNRTETLVKI